MYSKGGSNQAVNATNPPSAIKAELDDDGGTKLVPLEEVTEVIKQLCSEKAP